MAVKRGARRGASRAPSDRSDNAHETRMMTGPVPRFSYAIAVPSFDLTVETPPSLAWLVGGSSAIAESAAAATITAERSIEIRVDEFMAGTPSAWSDDFCGGCLRGRYLFFCSIARSSARLSCDSDAPASMPDATWPSRFSTEQWRT